MAKVKDSNSSASSIKRRPAISIEAREGQLIDAAMSLAEKQIMEGTASSQVITHFLKLGSTREKLEHELKMKELELTQAKTEQMKSMKRSEELFEQAINAFKNYSGQGDPDEYQDL